MVKFIGRTLNHYLSTKWCGIVNKSCEHCQVCYWNKQTDELKSYLKIIESDKQLTFAEQYNILAKIVSIEGLSSLNSRKEGTDRILDCRDLQKLLQRKGYKENKEFVECEKARNGWL